MHWIMDCIVNFSARVDIPLHRVSMQHILGLCPLLDLGSGCSLLRNPKGAKSFSRILFAATLPIFFLSLTVQFRIDTFANICSAYVPHFIPAMLSYIIVFQIYFPLPILTPFLHQWQRCTAPCYGSRDTTRLLYAVSCWQVAIKKLGNPLLCHIHIVSFLVSGLS